MSTRKTTFRPGVVELEAREVLTVLGTPQLVGGILTVTCSDTTTSVLIDETTPTLRVQDLVTNKVWTYAAGTVKRVDVIGGAGGDTFTVRGDNGVRARLYGNGGNDTIYGGNGRDIIDGGTGNDKLYGRGGNDVVLGADDDDTVDGGAGNDVVSGDNGSDWVNGGVGTDAISGGADDDVLVSIDGGLTDTVDGGPGADALWIDRTGTATDARTGVDGLDTVHSVAAFANGADRTLNGDRIADPVTTGGAIYERFTNRPLFASTGPSIDDIVQQINVGSSSTTPILDDGWLLAGLGSVVNAAPEVIAQNIVDFGDGTYGVALGGSFYRIDNDLPVMNMGILSPAYAALGQENSMWVPLYEKAFAEFQTGTPNYNTISGTGGASPAGTPVNVFAALGYTPSSVALTLFADSTQLGAYIQGLIDDGSPLALSVITPVAMSPLMADQAYSILSYSLNGLGDVSSVVVRNPWGIDGGGSMDSDPDDGLITVSIDDLFATEGMLESGT